MILYAWNTHTHIYIYMCVYTCDVIHACIWCLWRSSSCSRQRVAGHCRPTASTGTIYNCLGADMVMHGTTGWCGWFTKRGIQQEFLRSILKSKSNLETYGGWTQCIDVKQALRLSSCSLGVISVCVCASSCFFPSSMWLLFSAMWFLLSTSLPVAGAGYNCCLVAYGQTGTGYGAQWPFLRFSASTSPVAEEDSHSAWRLAEPGSARSVAPYCWRRCLAEDGQVRIDVYNWPDGK